MARVDYDEETDIVSIDFSSKKVFVSLEVSRRFIVDLSQNYVPIGIELLDASKVLSHLFGTKISKEELHKLHCTINEQAIEQNKELYASFKLNQNEAKLLIPTNYDSPVISS